MVRLEFRLIVEEPVIEIVGLVCLHAENTNKHINRASSSHSIQISVYKLT